MTFEDIPLRMHQLKVDRAWLAAQCDYTRGTLAAILAPNGSTKHKTDKSLRRMWEALDREEQRQLQEGIQKAEIGHRLYVDATDEQLGLWTDAAKARHQKFNEWARDALDRRAREELPSLLADRAGRLASPTRPPQAQRTTTPPAAELRAVLNEDAPELPAETA